MDSATNQLTAEQVEGWAASIRQEVAIDPPTPGNVRTPDQVIYDLEVVDAAAAKALRLVKDADKLRARTAEALLKAKARADGLADGKTAAERARQVETSVSAERAEAEAAKIAYRYAQGLADLLDSRRSSLQTQSKLVLATMQLAGIPRR